MKKISIVVFALLVSTGCLFAAPGAEPVKSPYKVDYWLVTAKGGVGYPMGSFGNNVDPSMSFGVSARKGFDVEFSAGGGITYVSMPYKLDAPAPFTATILDIEAVWSPYLPDLFLWPYGKVGIGGYLLKYTKAERNPESLEYEPKSVSETTIGFMFGGGINYPIGNIFAINAEVLYNHVSLAGGTGDQNSFLTMCAGVTVFLKNL